MTLRGEFGVPAIAALLLCVAFSLPASGTTIFQASTLPVLRLTVNVSDQSGFLGSITSQASATTATADVFLGSPLSLLEGMQFDFGRLAAGGSVFSSGETVSYNVSVPEFSLIFDVDGFFRFDVEVASANFDLTWRRPNGFAPGIDIRIDNASQAALTGATSVASVMLLSASGSPISSFKVSHSSPKLHRNRSSSASRKFKLRLLHDR